MSVRYTKAEIAARKTAEATIENPDASIQAKYHSRLILKSTERDAKARATTTEAAAPRPVTRHRVEVPPDPKARAFLDALEAMLEQQGETASAEAAQPETAAASVGPCAPRPTPPMSDEICNLCLIPLGNCGHGVNQSRGEVQ